MAQTEEDVVVEEDAAGEGKEAAAEDEMNTDHQQTSQRRSGATEKCKALRESRATESRCT